MFTSSWSRSFVVHAAVAGVASLGLLAASAAAQTPAAGTLTGRVINASTQQPVKQVTVLLEEQPALTAQTGADGTFSIGKVPAGSYHLFVTALGYVAARSEVTVGAQAVEPLTIELTPELHYSEVVSVLGTPRDQFLAVQPTSVLAGQDLTISLEGSLGAALESQPGIAERSFGPATSRPVIRGLDGDRVVVLEDGARTGDLSSQSGDHGVTVNPASSTRLEIVRGPAALLYGGSAIGGLINVIHDQIPVAPISGMEGNMLFDFASAASDGGGAADVNMGNGKLAFRVGAAARGSGDVDTPIVGTIENTQSRSAMTHLGLSSTSDKGYVGASYAYSDMKYGVPVVEDGQVELTPRRHSLTVKGERREMSGFISGLRGSMAYRRYRHDELVAGDVETRFKNDTLEFDLMANHREVGRLKGTIGGWGLTRRFESIGEEALSPPVDQNSVALFAFEEVTWPHVSFQMGARFDHNRYAVDSDELPNRDFNNLSASVGLLFRPTEDTTLAVSLARAARSPALEELYYFGAHPGNFAFEVGNADLEAEKALGVDVALRWRLPKARGEVAFFRNDISDFIFRRPMSEAEFDSRFGHEDGHGEFPFIEYVAADSVLQGIEAHTDIDLTSKVIGEVSFDYVRGELKEDSQPLPRMPPFRFIGGLRYHAGGLQLGGSVTAVSKQARLYDEETPTDGYATLKLFGAYSFPAGGLVNTITLRLDNATNEFYRNHLSLIKDFVPEMGRNFKIIYNVQF